MKPAVSTFATALLLLALQPAHAATINFGEFAAGNTNNAISNAYAPLGVTFGSDNSGIWNGLSLGDAGNWGIEGSNGSAFMGNNGFNNGGSYITSILFSAPVSNISFDASRSNGSSAGQQLVASAYNGSTLLSSQSVMLGAINSWTTVMFGIGSVSSLIITGSTTGFSPFGIDNLQFNGSENTLISGIEGDVSAIPEPETYALMLAGLGLLGAVTRKRGSLPATA